MTVSEIVVCFGRVLEAKENDSLVVDEGWIELMGVEVLLMTLSHDLMTSTTQLGRLRMLQAQVPDSSESRMAWERNGSEILIRWS